MPRENVAFKILENGNSDYELLIYNKDDDVIFTDTLNVHYFERPYLSEFKGLGKVHPNTGYLEVKVNGNILVSQRIKTDVEKIWDTYEEDILTECKNYILDKTNNNPTKEKQPFFDVLRLDILTSEPDYKLNIRQDIISVLSALHEDLYFVGLDFFKTLGTKLNNEVLDEPGLILPIINKRNGQGTYMSVTLESSTNDIVNTSNLEIDINEILVSNGELSKVYIDVKTYDDFLLISENVKFLKKNIHKEDYYFKELSIRYDQQELLIINDTSSLHSSNDVKIY